MEITREDYKTYCNGSLSESRSAEIEQYLQANPMEKRALDGAIAFGEKSNFEETLTNIDRKIDSQIGESNLKKPSKGRVISIGALSSLAAIAAIGLLLLFVLPTKTNTYSLDQYFNLYPDVLTNIVRGNSETSNNQAIRDGMFAYSEEDYKTASTLLGSIQKDQQQYETAKFYEAIALLGNREASKSLEIFEQLATVKAFPYEDGVQWYSALCYLELGNREKANKLLTLISELDHYKKEEAKQLLLSK